MDKGHEMQSDARLDSGVSASSADNGGDLTKDEGFDLNNDSDTNNASKTLNRSIGQRIGAGLLTPFAITGGNTSDGSNEHFHDILNSPEWNTHISTRYELPSYDSHLSQSMRDFDPSGEAPIIQIDGKEYDDGRFNPDAQNEAAELGSALNQPIAADITDPPPETDVEGIDLNEDPLEVETPEVLESPDIEVISNDED